MSTVAVPPWFLRDFEAVCKAYDCKQDEIEVMKQLARRDLEGAKRSYYLLARELERGVTGDVMAENMKERKAA